MSIDLQAARARLLSEMKNPDNSDRERAAVYFSEATVALDEIERQAKRIAELVGELDAANRYIHNLESKKNQEGLIWACDELNRKIDKQRAALKKLGKRSGKRGKALVEERAKLFHQFGDVELDPPSEFDCKFAREELHAEGLL